MRHLQGDVILRLGRWIGEQINLRLGRTTVSKLKMVRCMEPITFGDGRMMDNRWVVKGPIERWLNDNCPGRWSHRIDYNRGLCEFHFTRKGEATLFALTWR